MPVHVRPGADGALPPFWEQALTKAVAFTADCAREGGAVWTAQEFAFCVPRGAASADEAVRGWYATRGEGTAVGDVSVERAGSWADFGLTWAIAGFPKAGTTGLMHRLRQHPHFCAPVEEEAGLAAGHFRLLPTLAPGYEYL